MPAMRQDDFFQNVTHDAYKDDAVNLGMHIIAISVNSLRKILYFARLECTLWHVTFQLHRKMMVDFAGLLSFVKCAVKYCKTNNT